MVFQTHGRRLAAAVLAAGLAVSLAACGSRTTAAPAQASGEAQAPSGAAFPVTIEHKFGSTMLKAEPKRVVSVGMTDHDVLVALGVKPVGGTDWFGERPFANWPWIDAKWGDARPEVISNGSEVNLEKIASLRPDLIIGQYAGLNKEQYEKLSKIAPTVAQNGKFEDYSAPWRETTLTIGKALGKPAEAQKMVADIEAKFSQIRKEHPEFAGKKLIVGDGSTPGKWAAFSAKDPRDTLLAELGFQVDPKLDGKTKDGTPIQFGDEGLDLLDTDILVMLPEKPEDVSRIKENAVYANLAVTKADRVVYLPYSIKPTGAALSFATVLSIPYMIDEVVPQLSTAAKKL
nr:iron-siderophore ABC transporter substrate-binding protein [Kibdelosporangium sp. MJ126-NF4]CEL15359.1 ABC-type Fe3+-siderophore transport system, periplasmic iron-binding component [Kibdelosporangium sp. MJ126-NF4]